jgi:TolA-binding protein
LAIDQPTILQADGKQLFRTSVTKEASVVMRPGEPAVRGRPPHRGAAPMNGLRRLAPAAETAILLLLAIFAPPSSAQEAPDPIREIDALTQQWTSIEHQKDLLRAEWRTQEPVLEQQLALLEREIAELNTLLEATAQQQGEVEQRRLEMLEEQTRLEAESAALETALVQASIDLHSLHRDLPPPLAEAWTEELARLDNPVETVSERFRKLLELLGQLDDFNAKVTLNEAVMTLGDGNEHVVQQVYLGLSHGWYVTADQQFAAAGTTGPEGWIWTPVTDAAPIAKIVGILEQRVDPDFVSIALELNEPLGGGD